MALLRGDYATIARLLPAVIGELYAHVATGVEPARSEALKLLVMACGSDGTCMLRHLGETNLAYISGERGQQAADLLGDPVWRAAAAFGRAHARSSANKPKPLMVASDNRRAALRMEKARAHAMLDRDADAVRELRRAERLAPTQVHNHPLIRDLVADMLDRSGGRDLRGLAWRMSLI